jgi:predicted dehydrogenase
MNPSQRLAVYDPGVDREVAQDLEPDDRKQIRVSYRTGEMVAPALPEQVALRAMKTEFADSILQGRRPATDGHAGLRVMAILDAAERSLARDGAFVALEVL